MIATPILSFSVRAMLLCLVSAVLGTMELRAGNLNFQVQLVWGTNENKPKDPSLKELDSKLTDKLKGIFKWKNYFEVNRKSLAVSKDTPQKLRLSDKCDIEVQNLGNSMIEVKLWGEGKLVVKKRQAVVPAEAIVLAGDGKNDTAWFVVLTPSK